MWRRPGSPGELAINLLGPIPLPMSCRGKTVQWYAAVRSTDSSRLVLAADLNARGGQHLFPSGIAVGG